MVVAPLGEQISEGGKVAAGTETAAGKRVGTCESTSPADPQVSEKEGEEMLQALEQRFNCSL